MVKVFGTHDEATIQQLKMCVEAEEGAIGSLMADGHLGYSMPIGGVVAYPSSISPSGVGFDIGCGNYAVKTSLHAKDIDEGEWVKIARQIKTDIGFGLGRKAPLQIDDHPVLDRILHSPVAEQRNLFGVAKSQLGTVGSGNHYVDLLTDHDGVVWVANHFGSRGFGHKTATGFMNLAKGGTWGEGQARGESMMANPILLPLSSPLGQDYFECMTIAGEYAQAGREVVNEQVLRILGAQKVDAIHNHHNFAWMESHNGNTYCVVRKGATPISATLRGFVGGSMGDICVIIRGTGGGGLSLNSAMHGSGRTISRRKAAGKFRQRAVWQCSLRDCEYFNILTLKASMFKRGGQGECPICPKCGKGKMRKHFFVEQKEAGVVDWPYWQNKLKEEGIILVGAGADEAPQCYRPLQSVLDAHKEEIIVETVMRPKVVVMAGADEFDPYKD